MNSLSKKIHRLMNTSYTEIQLQITYLWTQLVIKLDNDRKKGATVPDWNAVNKVGYLPSIMTTLEIFFHIPFMTLQCNRIAPCIGVEISNNTVYSPFGE